MQILFLSRWFPYPPANGSKLRVYNLLRGLADHHDVTLLSFSDQPDVDSNTHALDSICRDAQVVQWEGFDTRSLRAHLGYLSLNPRSVVDTFSSELKQRLQQLLDTVDFDLIIASQIDMAGYSKYFGDVPALFDEVELGVLYEQFARAPSLWPRLRHALTWAKHRRYLASVLNNFLACTVVSDQEYQIITCAVRGYRSIEVIPNCVDLASYRGVRETHRSRNLIFTGSLSYYPNYEAMLWFLQKVYPRIQMNVLDVRLVITGNHGGRVLPPASNVDLTGFVDDVRPIISSSTISLVPLHTGGGTRLKILEAMALRTPVISTAKGAEGLDVQDGDHLLIADTPDEFTEAVICLLNDPRLRQRIVDNAYQLVKEKYDWKIVMPRFLDLVESVANTRAKERDDNIGGFNY